MVKVVSTLNLLMIAAACINPGRVTSAAEYFLDDAAVSVSGVVVKTIWDDFDGPHDDMWEFVPSDQWNWHTIQPGHGFIAENNFEDASANPATVELALGSGTYSNVKYLMFNHNMHSGTLDVNPEGAGFTEVFKDFDAEPGDIPGPSGFDYYWLDVPGGPFNVMDGALTLVFGNASAATGAPNFYSVGRLQADFEPNVPALVGDLNDDGFVGQDDLNIILGAWGQNVAPPGDWMVGDPSGDGFVGQDDLNDVLAGWGQGIPPTAASLTVVPEIRSVALLAIGLAGLLPLIRRRDYMRHSSLHVKAMSQGGPLMT